MTTLSQVEDFRKLEQSLGKNTSDLILKILKEREEMQSQQLATKKDIYRLESKLHQEIGNMAWKSAALLTAQTAVLMGLLKIAGVY